MGRSSSLDITHADEKQTLATATAHLAHVQKVSQLSSTRITRTPAGERRSREGCQVQPDSGLSFGEDTCSNADWALTLLSAARHRARNVFQQRLTELMKDDRHRRAPRRWETEHSMNSAVCHERTVSSCSQDLMLRRTLRDNRRGVARETRPQPFARISTRISTHATQWQERRFHCSHPHD